MPRRLFCRALFLLLCVAPTLGVAGWLVQRAVSEGPRGRLAALGERLGVRLEGDGVTTPRPGVVRLAGVAVREPESGRLLARADAVAAQSTADGWRLVAEGLTVEAAGLAELAAVADRLTRATPTPPASVSCGSVTLVEGARELGRWSAVTGTLGPLGADASLGRRLVLQSGGASPGTLRLSVTRNRQIDPPATRLTLQAGGAGLPWRLLGGLTPGRLSGDAAFTGELSAVLGAEPTGSFAGRLTGVDLAAWIDGGAQRLRLKRPATVDVQTLAWRDGRIERLAALVTAGAGAADRQLIYAANSGLRCGSAEALLAAWNTPAPGGGDTAIEFDELAFALNLDHGGLRLRGACRDRAGKLAPCVLAVRGEPLLYHPAEPAVPLAAAIGLLAPAEAAVRATGPLADAAARRLPAPRSPEAPLRVQR